MNLSFMDMEVSASFVYAGSSKAARIDLWESLQLIQGSVDKAWLVGGDFNCVSSPAKRKRGKPPNPINLSFFNDNIQKAGLFDLGFCGPTFTWRRKDLWERLDRFLPNDNWIQQFLQTSVTHLSLAGSDHRPLLITLGNKMTYQKSSFRYLNAEKEVTELEEEHNKGRIDEAALLEANERLLNAIQWQDHFLQQKAAKKRKFAEGDRNSKFYHACIKYQRKCNTIHSIKDQNGTWLKK
ncbi:uncharacterized protein LOC110033700 [Phalaenopsis equestris]|uniref:uncharacterized protein LOC110033700 n=1 Tax=Phalaenopsis equestris TaxID=78828 RepID=UPI0009E1DD70|nr:uncharacterized protein LOC110033700 [Phalaenopsis equestris]